MQSSNCLTLASYSALAYWSFLAEDPPLTGLVIPLPGRRIGDLPPLKAEALDAETLSCFVENLFGVKLEPRALPLLGEVEACGPPTVFILFKFAAGES